MPEQLAEGKTKRDRRDALSVGDDREELMSRVLDKLGLSRKRRPKY